ncbi:MAG TPA: ABC transporter substrate-binding protein [Vicinamibacterales bacterium]|nr:ABC transporter substrate-binding protein [Vicinamibacterales bacterium]
MHRRTLLRLAAALFCAPGGLRLIADGRSQDPGNPDWILIGSLLPRGAGGDEALAASARMGATLGVEEASRAASMLGRRLDGRVVDYEDAEAAARAARELFVRGAVAVAAAGDEAACAAISREAAGTGRTFFNLANPAGSLRSERHPATLSIGASETMLAAAAVAWVVGKEGRRRWFLLAAGDERASSGQLAEVRSRLLAAGGAIAGEAVVADAGDAAAAFDRIGRSADVAFACGPLAARVAVAGAYAARRRRFGLAGIGEGDGVIDYPAAGSWVVPWHHALERYGAGQLNARFRQRFGREMTGAAWSAWLAPKLVSDTLLRRGSSRASLLHLLTVDSARFDGHKGQGLAFGEDRQLNQPLYAVTRDRPGAGSPAVHEIPMDENDTRLPQVSRPSAASR